MILLDRLKSALGWGSEAPTQAPESRIAEAAGVVVDNDEDQWRRLTSDARRDLAPMTQARMQKVAAWLWEANLLANRLVELPIAYLLADGVRLTCPDEEGQRELDRFWNDPINRMDERLPELLRGLAVFGELCLPAFPGVVSGRVRLGYLDPALIETVVADPLNPAQPIGIVTTKDRRGEAQRWAVIVLGTERDCFGPRTQAIRATFQTGVAFWFTINALPGGVRGRSDLLAQADWLDGYDQFLFGELDRAQFMRAFVWDVTLKGATAADVEERAKKISTPKPGTMRVHNDSEEWNAVTPGLQAADLTELGRLVRNHALGGMTIPEHWFGGGGDVNRAVGAEMSEPTMKMFGMRQRTVKTILETVGRYVLWSTLDPTTTREPDWESERLKCEAVFPEMSPRDTSKHASALQQVVAACDMAIQAGLMTELMAVQVIATVAGKLGVEVDAEDELDAARKERAKREDERSRADAFSDSDPTDPPPDPQPQE